MSHSNIVSLILRGGDMNKNDLISKTYRHIIEAMNKAEHGAVSGYEPGPQATDIAEDCSTRIVEDVFGAKSNEDQVVVGEVGSKDVKVLFQGAPFEVVTWLREVPDTVFAVQCADHPDMITSDDYLRKYENVGKPVPRRSLSEFVDQYYEMDPQTEDVLDNGTLVVDGMVVLQESPDSRAEIYDGMDSSEISQARMKNRWATVQHAKVENQKFNGPMLSFIAVYDDGVKRKRTTTVNHAWIVKKDSIPRTDSIYSIHEEVYIFHGVTAKVVGILRDFNQNEKHLYRVRAGVDGELMSIDEYLTAENPKEEGVSQEVLDDQVIDSQGAVLYVGKPERVREFLKSFPSDYANTLKVRVSGCDSLTSVLDYWGDALLSALDDHGTPTYDVVASDGTIVFNGTETETVMWLNAQPRDYRAGCVVGRTESPEVLSAGAFLDLAGNKE